MSDPESRQALSASASEATSRPVAVPARFNFGRDVVDRLARDSDKPALIWSNASGEERRLLFSDVARLSAQLASALRSRGIAAGDRIMVMMPRIPEWQIAMVACLKLGAVAVPCIEMLTAKDVTYRVLNSGSRAALIGAGCDSKFDEVADELAVRMTIGGAAGWEDLATAIAEGDPGFEPAVVLAEDPAILYYTSGSTGMPKGVLHASRALFAWRHSAAHWLDLSSEDVIWCTADVGWSKAGTSILFGPWSLGACAFFYDGPFDARQRLELLQKHGITVFCASGTELFRLLNEKLEEFDLSRLRRTVTAGEALNPAVASRWMDATGIAVAEAYGQTETLMTLINPAGVSPRIGSMGVAMPGLHLDVISAEGERLPPGTTGDLALLLPNPQLMLGYWGEPDRTESCFLNGPDGRWFVTGDLAERDTDGYFYHRGRNDDIINSAGYRIGPSEVENALLDHPAVQEAAAVGSPDLERGEIVKAFVVLRPGYEGDQRLCQALQTHVKQLTAPYKYPRAIEFVTDLPKTPTGKIRRVALREREKAGASRQPHSPAPPTI